MYQNAALVEALVRARVADLRDSAEAAALTRGQHRRRHAFEAARSETGWRLVELGLRLALPRGAMHEAVRRG